MAEANELEQMAKNAQTPPQEKKEEPKKVSTLEGVVNDLIYGAKTFANMGLAIGAPLAFGQAFPAMKTDAYVLSGAQVAGDATTARKRGEKYTSLNSLESSLQGIALTPLAAHPKFGIFPLINKIPTDDLLGYITKGAVWGGVAYPIWMGAYQVADYLIKKRTFKGLGTYLKQEYWPALKKAWKTLYPISLLNIFFAPLAWQIPIGAALSYALALFGAPKKGDVPEEKKRDTTPYYVAASNALGRGLYNLFWAPLNATYALGNAARNLYDKIPAASPPQLAPATSPAPKK